jgi:hypothetical protein
MAVSKDLSRFTRDALMAGRSRDEISQALTSSGWAASEAEDALNAWADTGFVYLCADVRGLVVRGAPSGAVVSCVD